MSLPPLVASSSAAGISANSEGSRVVLGSRRPDGTYRKELKIRPGYTPEEDVARYRLARGGAPVGAKPAIPGLAKQTGAPSVKDALRGMSRSQKKAVKVEKEDGVRDDWDAEEDKVVTGKGKEVEEEAVEVKVPVEDDKRVKALKKKLRQTEMLRERQAAGLYLPPSERAKLLGIADLEDELAQLTLAMGSITVKDDDAMPKTEP